MPDEYVSGFIADDSKSLSSVLTKEYAIKDLEDFFGEIPLNEASVYDPNNHKTDLSIDAVNQKFPIECLRKSGYTVYKVSEGGYFYVFWARSIDPNSDNGLNSKSNSAFVYFTSYITSLKKARDFDSIKEGISTAADVATIDPSLELIFLMSSRTPSYSLLDDGNIMEICYHWNESLKSRNDLIVESKKIIVKDQCPSALSHILISDLP